MSSGLICVLLAAAWADPTELHCLPAEERRPADSRWYRHLQKEAYTALDRRAGEVNALRTPEDVAARQARLREFFVQQLGGFPEKTPLNARLVGTLEGPGYRIEKLIFESRPQHHVTANLYLPEGAGPHPCVLIASGHSRPAKADTLNQKLALSLVQHGMAAFAYDPIGQGERSQILADDGRPQFEGTTHEHFLVGVGSILVGANTAAYRVWDGIRAIDYVCSRDDLDPARIGFAGCSGGGTVTSYLMALDDRVRCAAPACYLTTFRRLLETLGPQDAEQNIFGQLAAGLDHPDYVIMRAPRPTLISATTDDFFDIQGSWDNLRQSKRIYALLGASERVDLVEAPGKHGVQPANRAAMVQWLQRWLLDKDASVAIDDPAVRPPSELQCTERGQVLLLPEERSVFALNADRQRSLAARRAEFQQQASAEERRAKIRQLTGIRPLADRPRTTWEKAGRVEREGYHIDKVILQTDAGVPLPALTFHPADPLPDAYLYLHDGGKTADAGPDGPIEKLVQAGYVVVAVDLSSQGENGPATTDKLLGDWKTFYLAYLLGKSLVGQHADDCLAAGQWIAYYQTEKPRPVHLVAVGNTGIAALHAAALEPEQFASVTLRQTPRDWASLVAEPVPTDRLSTTVHGALEFYDLPDLEGMMEKERLRRE